MSGLTELRAKLEAAGGPSRDIDKAILRWLGFTWRGMDYWHSDNKTMWTGRLFFTSLTDDAIYLAERLIPGCVIRMGTDEGPCWACINGLEELAATAPTLPLAIVKAVLANQEGASPFTEAEASHG